MLQKMAFLPLNLYIRIKGDDGRGLHEIFGDRFGRWEKAKQGNLWDWIKSKNNRHKILLHRWV